MSAPARRPRDPDGARARRGRRTPEERAATRSRRRPREEPTPPPEATDPTAEATDPARSRRHPDAPSAGRSQRRRDALSAEAPDLAVPVRRSQRTADESGAERPPADGPLPRTRRTRGEGSTRHPSTGRPRRSTRDEPSTRLTTGDEPSTRRRTTDDTETRRARRTDDADTRRARRADDTEPSTRPRRTRARGAKRRPSTDAPTERGGRPAERGGRPGRLGRARAFAAQRVQARRAQPDPDDVGAGRASFVVAIIALLVVGVAATLWLSTQAIADSYRLERAKTEADHLAEQVAVLQREVARMESAPELARRARELGMVPAGDAAWLVVSPDGKVTVVGEPTPVTAPPPTSGVAP
ncbi:hypothetical protein [Actinokineospora sp. NPDC004072]